MAMYGALTDGNVWGTDWLGFHKAGNAANDTTLHSHFL